MSIGLRTNAGNEISRSGTWLLVVPPGSTSVTASLPSSDLMGAAQLVAGLRVQFIDADVLTSQSFRRRPLPWIAPTVLPQRTTLRTTSWPQ